MKFICDTADLTQAATVVQRAITSKSVNPILSGIRIKTTDLGLELCGYDTEVGITTVVQAGIRETGGIITNEAKNFCDILRHLPTGTISFSSDEKNRFVLESGDTKYTLSGRSVDDFPEMPYVMGGTPIVLPKRILKDMIRQVIFAVSIDESKTVHRGVKFDISRDCLKLIALDGFRLSVRKETVDYKGEPIHFIVPSKTLSEVIKILDDDEGFVSVNLGKKHIVFGTDDCHIVSGILEGDFIDYSQVIPHEFDLTAVVPTQPFIDSIDRMSLLISEKNRTPLRCIFDNNEIRLLSNSTLGSANDKIDVQLTGPRIEKGFNNRYLLEALRAIDGDTAIVQTGTEYNLPLCITPPEGDAYFYMILPVHLPEKTDRSND